MYVTHSPVKIYISHVISARENVTCGNLRDISQGIIRTTVVMKCRIQRYDICKIKFKSVKGLDNRIQKFAMHFSTTWRNNMEK